MAVIEIGGEPGGITQRQRYSHYFVLVYAVIAFIIGINLRDATLYATVPYADTEVGIRAFYPQNWLLDTEGDAVLRVRDMAQTGYKTTIQVTVLPVTINMRARNILDNLIITRSQTLSEFGVLSLETTTLRDLPVTAMTYTFASGEINPFLESLPRIVQGYDILVIQGGQAVVITLLSDTENYAQTLPIFERFLDDLEF